MMYILDKDHNPIKLEISEEGFKTLWEFMAKDAHVVMQTKMASPSSDKHLMISTIFLCISPSSEPMYETMIFDFSNEEQFFKNGSQYCARHATWDDALEGHDLAEKHAMDILSADVLKDELN